MKRFVRSVTSLRLILVTLFAFIAVAGFTQKPYEYDSSHKYGLFSNWEIGVLGQYSNNHGVGAFGLGGLATKKIDDLWRLRYEARINGITVTDGFDRYGTALAGIQFDFLKWAYAFADMGVVVDPTMPQKFGLAANAGLGLATNFGKWSVLRLEGGSDLVQSGNGLQNTFFVSIGYSVRTGITETDRVAIDIDNTVHSGYGDLKQENQLLKSEAKKREEDNAKLQDLLERSIAALEVANQRVSTREADLKQLEENCESPLPPIFFGYASATVPDLELPTVEFIASYIKTNGGSYRIEGYSSPDGNDYNNQKLSGDRAFTVYQMLTEWYGVSQDQLIPMGNGVSTKYGADSDLNRCVLVTKSPY